MAPAGVPKEIVEICAAAIKKAINNDEDKKKMGEQGLTLRYMDPAQMDAYWTEYEEQVKLLVDAAKQE